MITKNAAAALADMIKKAIEDLVVTTTEYEAIINQAEEDGIIDRQEQVLLAQLQNMIADGLIKRVPG